MANRGYCESFGSVNPPVAPDTTGRWGKCSSGHGLVKSCGKCQSCPDYMPREPRGEFGLYIVATSSQSIQLQATLDSAERSDWPSDEVHPVYALSRAKHHNAIDVQCNHYYHIMRTAYDAGHEWTLIVEDDVEALPNLYGGISGWWPVTTNQLHVGLLFIPDPDHDQLDGSQAFLWSREGLRQGLDRWYCYDGRPELRAISLCRTMGWSVWYSPRCWVRHRLPVG